MTRKYFWVVLSFFCAFFLAGCQAGLFSLLGVSHPVPHAQALPGGGEETRVIAVWLEKTGPQINYIFRAGDLNKTIFSGSEINKTSVRLNASSLTRSAQTNPNCVIYAGNAFYHKEDKNWLVDVEARDQQGRTIITFTAQTNGEVVDFGYPKP